MGALLFMLGLLTGAGIPSFRSPRIGLSAHLDALESGLALICFGLILPHLAISPGWAGAIAHSLWISLYLLWLGLIVAAVYGTGKTLPIAGADLAAKGLTAKAWQENTARLLISIGSLGSAAAVLAILIQWRWTP
jgi:hydroxylaminobenzene mutase